LPWRSTKPGDSDYYFFDIAVLEPDSRVGRTKKAAVASGPKFREETPKKGCDEATPIAISHCTN
jgi:hypothetical protein